MSAPATPCSIAPVLESLPRPIRRRLSRLAHALEQIERDLVAAFPMADALSVDPALACSLESTPEDHVLADLIAVARMLRHAIDDLAEPILCACDDGSSAHDLRDV